MKEYCIKYISNAGHSMSLTVEAENEDDAIYQAMHEELEWDYTIQNINSIEEL